MYFCRFKKEYLPAIAKLEAEVYPPEMVLGLTDLEKDMKEKNLSSYSVAGFSKGELVCYIAAYEEVKQEKGKKRYIYISDINCCNPFYLKRLLLVFFAKFWYGSFVFKAEMRESSYHLLANEKKREARGIIMLEDTYIPEYYLNGEGAHKVTFMADYELYLKDNWKEKIQLYIDQMGNFAGNNLWRGIFCRMAKQDMKHINFREEKNMRFILGRIKEALVDYYYMFSDRIPMKIVQRLPARFDKTLTDEERKKKYEKTLKTYLSYGFDEEKYGNHSIWYDEYWRTLEVSKTSSAYNTQYRDSLSGLRWLWKKEVKFLRSQKYFDTVEFFNRYGVSHPMIKIPYLTKKHYLYMVEKMEFIRKEREIIEENGSQEGELFEDMCEKIYGLLSGSESRECILCITSRKKENQTNYFHDWNMIVNPLMEARDILTQGAVKSILMKPYHQALKLSKCVKTVMKVISQGDKIREPLDRKTVRKNFSSLLRQNKECTTYVNGLTYEMERKYRLRLHLPASQENKIIEFVDRMKRYCPMITFYDIFHDFGPEILGQFIKGTYPCIFLPQEISLSYWKIGIYVEELLKKKTKQAKHLYYNLVKKGLLTAILEHEMTRIQCREVLELLKYHNVELKIPEMRGIFDFKAFVEIKGSPEFLTAGDASVCCMSFGSTKAYTYAKEKGFGIINIYYRERVVANSLIWINEPYNCLVLDNIEVHPNYIKFHMILKEFFFEAAEKLIKQYELKFAVQGEGYNDLSLYGEHAQKIRFQEIKPVGVETNNFYTDAIESRVICQNISDDELSELIRSKEIYKDISGTELSEEMVLYPYEFFDAA